MLSQKHVTAPMDGGVAGVTRDVNSGGDVTYTGSEVSVVSRTWEWDEFAAHPRKCHLFALLLLASL